MARSVPTIATETPGNFLTGALWNANVKALGDFLSGSAANGVPRFRGYQASAQSLADNTWTSLTIDTEVYDSDNGHSTTTSTSRYVVQVAGTYMVIAAVGFVANTSGNRAVRVAVNGASITGSFVKTTPATSTGSTGLVTACHVVCAAGDYIEAMGNQNSGSALSTVTGTDVCSALDVQWISG